MTTAHERPFAAMFAAMIAMLLAMLLVVLVPATAAAQSGDVVGGLAEDLRQGGLEGLVGLTGEGISDGDASVYAFEYRLARSPAEGVCRLLEAAAQNDDGPVTVVVMHAGISTVALNYEPSASTTSVRCAGYRLSSNSYRTGPYLERLRSARRMWTNPSLLDVVVGVHYGIRWGSRWDPVESHASLAPRLQLRMWRGMELSAELLLPMWSEIGGETAHVRPGQVALSQIARLPGPTFIRFAGGTFSNGRYGGDVQLRTYAFGGHLFFGFDAGYTGEMSYPNGSLSVDPDGRTVAMGTAGGFIPKYDTFLQVSAGHFLYGDWGVQASAVRRFGGLDVGFHATKTELGRNAGFQIVLPLFRGRAVGGRSFRVRPEPHFGFRYEYTRDGLAGRAYDAGTDLDALLQQQHPIFLPHRVRHVQTGTR